MKLFLVAFVVSSAAADRLENTYLPPASSRTAAGSNFLAPPHRHIGNSPTAFGTSSRIAATSYAAPASGPVTSSGLYDAPSVGSYAKSAGGAPVAILRLNNDNDGDGSYRFEFETENRISQQESGQVKNAGTDQESSVVQGSYSFTAPDGVTYTVNYVADENGFRASGDHIPTPPPVPAAILKSLESSGASGVSLSRSGYPAAPSYQSPEPSRQYLTPRASHRQSAGYRY